MQKEERVLARQGSQVSSIGEHEGPPERAVTFGSAKAMVRVLVYRLFYEAFPVSLSCPSHDRCTSTVAG